MDIVLWILFCGFCFVDFEHVVRLAFDICLCCCGVAIFVDFVLWILSMLCIWLDICLCCCGVAIDLDVHFFKCAPFAAFAFVHLTSMWDLDVLVLPLALILSVGKCQHWQPHHNFVAWLHKNCNPFGVFCC